MLGYRIDGGRAFAITSAKRFRCDIRRWHHAIKRPAYATQVASRRSEVVKGVGHPASMKMVGDTCAQVSNLELGVQA